MTTPSPLAISGITALPNLSTKSTSLELRVVRNGNVLHVVGLDSNNSICINEGAPMAGYARKPAGNASALTSWTQTKVGADSSDTSLSYKSTKRLGVTVAGDATYIFWIDSKANQLCATRLVPDTVRTQGDWCAIMLPDSNGTPVAVTNTSAGVCATAGVLPGEILVSFLSTTGGHSFVTQITLNVADYDQAQNSWLARAPAWSLPIPAPAQGVTITTCDIRCLIAEVPDGQRTGIFLFGAIWDTQGHNVWTLAWQLAADGRAANTSRTEPIALQWPAGTAQRQGNGIALSIDPAGRLLAIFSQQENSNKISAALIADLSSLVAGTTTQLTWVEYSLSLSSQSSTLGAISILFTPCSKEIKPVTKPASYPLTLTLCWIGSDCKPYIGGASYASAQMQKRVTLPSTDADAKKCYVTSVCDPFPIPQPSPQLWDNSTPDGMADWLLFEYAFLNGHSKTRVVDMEWRIGGSVSMEFRVPLTGIGAGFKLDGGGILSTSDMTSAYTAQGMKVQSKACTHPLAAKDTDGPYALRPYGTYASKTMLSLVRVDYTVSNLAFTPAGGGNSISFVSYTADASDDNVDTVTGDYFCYAVTPGDISSYSKESIDKRMVYLYQKLTQDMSPQDIARIFSYRNKEGKLVDLTGYYDGVGSYVDKIIRDFGVTLDVGDYDQEFSRIKGRNDTLVSTSRRGRKHISYALSGMSVSDGTFMVKKGHSFGFGGYLNLDVYGNFDINSIIDSPRPPDDQLGYSRNTGWEARFQFSFEIMTEDTDERTTAISMNTYYNPLSATQSLAARLYAFRPSPLWAIELKYFPQLAHDDYIAGLKATAAANALGITAEDIDDNPDFKGVISNSSNLLVSESLPSRYLLVVTHWDASNYAVTPPFAITTYYPSTAPNTSAKGLPTTPLYAVTGSAGGSVDTNYTVLGKPADVVTSPASLGYVAPPAGSQWITAATVPGATRENTDFDYLTEVFLPACVPNATRIQGQLAADDTCTIYVNGELLPASFVPSAPASSSWCSSLATFTIPPVSLKPGANQLLFRVHNTVGTTGLLVSRLAIATLPNTGLGGGVTDPNYRVAERGGSGTPSLQAPYILYAKNHAWVAAPPGAEWISVTPTATDAAPQGDFDFTTTIRLDASSLDGLVIRGRCAADDHCTILVNGTVVPNPWGTGQAQGAHFGGLSAFTIPVSCLRPGDNVVIFRVSNIGPGPTGLLVLFDSLFPG